MKKFLILAFLALIACSVSAKQTPTTEITNVVIKKINNNVEISFDAFVPKIRSDYKLTLTPMLYADLQSQSLQPIVIVGRNKRIVDKRTAKLVHGQIIGKAGKVISYRVTIGYQNWMNEVSLKLNAEIEGCCDEIKQLSSLILTSNKLIHYDIDPKFNLGVLAPKLSELEKLDQVATYLYPATDYDRRYEIFEQQREKGALVVYFQQGYSSIDPCYKNNKQTLAKVNKVLDLIAADTNVVLKKMVIFGLASPEGSLAKNDILAEKRATSLKYFAGKRLKYDPNLFELINGSEDWNGLKTLVENSHMPNRWQVLEIMQNYSVRGGREVELMKLNIGIPYNYMKEHFFPQLRNAGYIQIYYDSTPNVDAERTNSAIKLIKNKEYDKALTLLLSVKSGKELANMIGVCYMMTGDYEQATTYFDKAIAQGHSDATEAAANLDQIRILQSIK